MTPREMCTPGRAEALKLVVHGTMGVTAALCAVYNAAAWFYRRETHSAVNAVIYTALTILEVQHIKHHCEAS